MTSSIPQKRINGDDMDCDDIISHLPGEIKDKILTKLPIKDVVRTSILSNKWRYTWASIPEIVVKDDDLVPTVHRGTLVAQSHFVKNVDFLLFNHNRPILNFNLSTNYHIPEAFDRWILNLSRNGITELTFFLNSESLSKYRIHSSFFRCDALQHVDLSECLIELPRGFEGLKLLRYLTLDTCTISAADLEWLISSSPNLVKLSLNGFQTKDDLRIFSSGLKILTVWGVFSDLQIDAPNLDVLVIGCYNDKDSAPRVKKFCQSLNSLSNLQQICLLGFSVQYLMGEAVVEFSRTFGRLKVLSLCADLTDKKESNFVFSLLQNAVKLKQLYLAVFRSTSTCSSFWEERSNLGFALEHLQEVSIAEYKTSEPLLAFIKLILGLAPVLKKLILNIERGPKEEDLMVFKRLLKFRRASADAEVVIE